MTFLLQVGFTSASVFIEEAGKHEAEKAGTIIAELNAFNCPAASASKEDYFDTPVEYDQHDILSVCVYAAAASKEDCFDTPVEYDQNDILSVCIYDQTENSVITFFKDVTLGNGQISTQVIDSDRKPTS